MIFNALRMSQNSGFYKNNIPSSLSDTGAEGYGIVVFGFVTTIPYSGRSIFFLIQNWSERWNIVTILYF